MIKISTNSTTNHHRIRILVRLYLSFSNSHFWYKAVPDIVRNNCIISLKMMEKKSKQKRKWIENQMGNGGKKLMKMSRKSVLTPKANKISTSVAN